MIERKDISLTDLKYYYDTRNGFSFMPESDMYADVLADVIKASGASEVLPEFVTHINGSTIFVYPENATFDSGAFFKYSGQVRHILPMVQIDMLGAWLKNH